MFRLTRCVLGFVLAASLWLWGSALAAEPQGIEVFTVRDRPISGGDDLRLHSVAIRVYEIDGLGHLESALSVLAAEDRTIVWLHDVEGYNHREIAELFGKTESFSKTRLSRARSRLRDLLDAGMSVKSSRKAAAR